MKLKLFISLLLFIPSLLFSQNKGFLPGSIQLKEGSKLTGFIKNIGKKEKCLYIVFKSDIEATAVKYYPELVKSYEIENDGVYQSSRVNLLGETINREIFIKHLVAGELSLFRLDYEAENTPAPFLTYNDTYYIIKDGSSKGKVLPINRYKEQAFEFAPNCEAKNRQYSYNETDLIELIVAVNTCNDRVATVLVPEKTIPNEPTVRPGFLFGLHHNGILSDNPNLSNLYGGAGGEFGLLIDIKLFKQFSLRQGIHYINKQAKSSIGKDVEAPFTNKGENLSLDESITLNHIVVPIVFKQKFTAAGSKFQPYAFIGGQFGISVKSSANFSRAEIELEDGFPTGRQVAIHYDAYNYAFANFDFGVRGGAGLEYLLASGNSIFLEFVSAHTRNAQPTNTFGFYKSTTFGGSLGFLF